MLQTIQKGLTAVFFDGGCPLCRKEIAHYQRLDRKCRINWIDITASSIRLEDYNLTFDKAMRRIHAIDRTGNMITGVEAFMALWSELPGYRYLPHIIRTLYLQAPLQWLYEKFAERRYRKRKCLCKDQA